MPPDVVCAEENAGGRVGEGGVGGSGCVGSVVEVVGSERYGVGAVEHAVEKTVGRSTREDWHWNEGHVLGVDVFDDVVARKCDVGALGCRPFSLKLEAFPFSQTQSKIILTSSQRGGEVPGFQEGVDDCYVDSNLCQGGVPFVVGWQMAGEDGYVEGSELGEAVDDVCGFFEDH